MNNAIQCEIGVFGGTGLYSLLDSFEEIKVETPYGDPSDLVVVGRIFGRSVAFLPRHGRKHIIPPHKIPYLANMWAFKSMGIQSVIAPSACGSLQPDIHPGSFVVSDQFFDRTRGRTDTFYDGPEVTHISSAEPYCPTLRKLAIQQISELGIPYKENGCCVVIQGPRFSTMAESEFFTRQGWHTVNMTQYPEVVLARELEMCYVNISLVTDYDAGVVGCPGTRPTNADEILKVLQNNNKNVKLVIERMLANWPDEFLCGCRNVLSVSRI